MRGTAFDEERIVGFITRRHGVDAAGVRLRVEPLLGGLQAAGVARVEARYMRGARSRLARFVVKRLDNEDRRESEVYALLAEHRLSSLAPRLLESDPRHDATYLYLDCIRPSQPWPWREVSVAGLVLRRLARVHTSPLRPSVARVLSRWNYEEDLRGSALSTLAALEGCASHERLPEARRTIPSLRLLVSSFPAVRARVLGSDPLGLVLLHGDVHPGNVMIAMRGGRERSVLLDWGRARLGAPLEDVGSWLQSLGCWEPEARRRHDTLLREYCAARGLPDRLSDDFRDAYWLASACNVLSGALRYHLSVVTDACAGSHLSQAEAAVAARDCLRVIRRAAEGLRRQARRSGEHDRRTAPGIPADPAIAAR
jgi:hypothetical protein